MAATGTRFYTPNPFEFNVNGVPLAGARYFFYETATSDLLATYADVLLTTPNPNPVVADANGRFGTIFLIPSTAYKIQLWTAATVLDPVGEEIWSMDPCGPAAGGGATNTIGIIGEVRAFAGPAAAIPALWYVCDGLAVSRTTYASLFAVIGITWGAGDASTTFNLPDLRGRSMFGKDNMGGSAANRLTSGVSGISGVTLGASGGSESQQTHTHVVNDAGHIHAITDPTHDHDVAVVTAPSGGATSGVVGNSLAPATVPFAVSPEPTGITIDNALTGVTLDNTGLGAAENVPPAAVVNFIIYAGA